MRAGIFASVTQAVKEPIAISLMVLVFTIELSVFSSHVPNLIVTIVLLYRGINSVISVQASYQSAMENIGSIEKVSDEINRLSKGREAILADTSRMPNAHDIEFRDVCYKRNQSDEFYIGPINLTIPERKLIAIVGKSGSGKSTLAELLALNTKPDSGKILIGGVDSTNVDIKRWRKSVGYVSQNSVVLSGSVADNIAYGSLEQPSRVEILKALRGVNLEELATEIEGGISREIVDFGANLSTGQKQRLMFAREVYRKPKLLILDEPTSALDGRSEGIVDRQIVAASKNCAVLLITHRLNILKHADYIYVIDNGQICEEGTYETLTASRSSQLRKEVILGKNN